ncbi:hypothetical protein NDU88_006142 [Pleurodeles waltl]|uniref:Uncharacterized protein n=1 Tax=Pleurodeles waltl TaxID=8319 RepID=A0AAV7VM10_PLEWA|nr:hypothetical protein NDU88_006142 [Pleurodeles waltl]
MRSAPHQKKKGEYNGSAWCRLCGARREKGGCGERSLVRRQLLLQPAHVPPLTWRSLVLGVWFQRVWEPAVLSGCGPRVS